MTKDGSNRLTTTQKKKRRRRSSEELEKKVAERTAKLIRTNERLQKEIEERRQAEEALREGESNFRTLADHATASIFVVQDEKFVYINRNFTEGAGYTLADLATMPFWDIIAPEMRDQMRANAAARQQHNDSAPKHYELKIITKSGEERIARIGVTGIQFNRRPAILGLVINITEPKEAERKLQESEAMLAHAQQIAHVGHWERDLTTGKVRWSDETYRIFGLEPQTCEVNGPFLFEHVHPDDRAPLEKAIRDAAQGLRPYDMLYRPVRPDGSLRRVHARGEVTCISGRKPSHIFGTILDITERRIEEELLKEYERAVESTDEMIAVVDRGYRYRLANAAFLNYRGKSKEEVIGRLAEEVLGKDVFEQIVKENLDRCFRGEVVQYEMKYTYPELGERQLLVSYLPIRGFEGVDRVATVIRDITEQKQAKEALKKAHKELERRVDERTKDLQLAYNRLVEEAKQRERLEEQLRQAHKMEAIGTLAGGIAHDFNNILAAMIGFSELAMDDIPADAEVQSYLKRILAGGLRGRELVKQILAFSRKSEGEKKEISLTPLVKETDALLRASLPSTIQMQLINTTDDDHVLADPTQVQQVLVNLATNAAYAMRERGGQLTIGIASVTFSPGGLLPDPDLPLGAYVLLTVKDTGTGMVEEVRQRIFEPFFTTKGKGVGTGMGLAVVYGVVKNHGGAITVRSAPGQGSLFEVFLPQAQKQEAMQEETTSLLPTGTERILFVDDEEMLVEMGQRVLESLGYNVNVVQHGSDAWNLFLEDPFRFDLVITDQTMPDITGITLAQKMLRVRKGMPIILCTGYSETVSAERAKEAGISAFVMKPVMKKELAETVRRALDRTTVGI